VTAGRAALARPVTPRDARVGRFRKRRRVNAVAQRLEASGLSGLAAPALATVPVAMGTLRLARVAMGRTS
jgi:hypothetical protein